MTPLSKQLAQVKRQKDAAQRKFDNLYGTYDQPDCELRRASEILETQKDIVKSIELLIEKEKKAADELAKEWKEEKP